MNMKFSQPNAINQIPPGPAVIWMTRPQQIPGCPVGLEYLTQVDSLFIQQKVSILEAVTGFDTNNKYFIRNSQGQQIYFAAEDTDTCMRICCGAQRRFQIFILDNLNQQIMRISREFKCCAGCCWCAGCCESCSHEVVVEAPIGNIIGYVKQTGSFWKAKYDILDENHNPVLKIQGPCCICDGPFCPCENEFSLMTLDGSAQIGKISKEYSGFFKEMFTLADNFSVRFPVDLSVKVKATLLGALFLIDFMFFETKPDNNND